MHLPRLHQSVSIQSFINCSVFLNSLLYYYENVDKPKKRVCSGRKHLPQNPMHDRNHGKWAACTGRAEVTVRHSDWPNLTDYDEYPESVTQRIQYAEDKRSGSMSEPNSHEQVSR